MPNTETALTTGIVIEPSDHGIARQRVHSFTFADLQREVGGYVEYVRCAEGVLAVNEDGLPLGLRPNLTASTLACRPIVGTVVLLDRAI